MRWANGLFELQNRNSHAAVPFRLIDLEKSGRFSAVQEVMGLSRLKTFRSKRIIWTNCNRLNLSSPDWDETKLLRRNRPDFERYVCVHGFEIITDRHNNDAVLFGHLEHHRKFSGVRNYNEKPRHEVCVPWDLQTAFFVKLLWALTWNFNLPAREGHGFSFVGVCRWGLQLKLTKTIYFATLRPRDYLFFMTLIHFISLTELSIFRREFPLGIF